MNFTLSVELEEKTLFIMVKISFTVKKSLSILNERTSSLCCVLRMVRLCEYSKYGFIY